MTEREAFERSLFASLASGEMHFPRALLDRADEAPRDTIARSLLARAGAAHHRLADLLGSPVLAYALLLALALPAYRGLSREASPPPPPAPGRPAAAAPTPPPGLESARLLELGAGATRATADTARLALSARDTVVALSFLVPVRSGPGVAYRAVITDASGRVVAARDPLEGGDGLGNFVLVCPSGLFADGAYVLTVSGTPGDGSARDDEHRFSFRVTRAPE